MKLTGFIDSGIKNKLRMSYKKLSVTSSESQSDVNVEKCNEYLEITSRIDPRHANVIYSMNHQWQKLPEIVNVIAFLFCWATCDRSPALRI